MKKKSFLLLTVIMIIVNSLNCFAYDVENETEIETETETEGDSILSSTDIQFRGYEWGAAQEDVIRSETEDLSYKEYTVQENYLKIYSGSVGGYAAEIVFWFNDYGQLYKGTYSLTEGHHLAENEYYTDYCDLVEQYSKKYGEPYFSEENWESNKYKYDSSQVGNALLTEQVSFESKWMDYNLSYITMELYGDSLNIYTTITYSNINFVLTTSDDSGI